MEELLDALIARNITESEEALRLIISSLNGLAGIYLLLQNPIQAVEEYRKVLQLAERFNMGNEQLTVDSLQLIHTMYNLSEILATASPVPPTLRDASLTDERKKLEEKYIGRYLNQVCYTDFQFKLLSFQVQFGLSKLHCSNLVMFIE